jgi:hypothetical protein
LVGSTRISYSGYNDLLAHGIMTCFWPSYDPSHTSATYAHSFRVSEALAYGKYYMKIYKGAGTVTSGEFHMFHWFGDPEMRLRTRSPLALTVYHPDWIHVGTKADIVVQAYADGQPVEAARVALSTPTGNLVVSGLTDAAGEVVFPGIALGTKGSYGVVVTAHDCAPYEGIIKVNTLMLDPLQLEIEPIWEGPGPLMQEVQPLEQLEAAPREARSVARGSAESNPLQELPSVMLPAEQCGTGAAWASLLTMCFIGLGGVRTRRGRGRRS